MTTRKTPTLKRFVWLLLIPLALACNLLSDTPEPTPAPLDTPVMLSPSAMPPATVETADPTTLPPTAETPIEATAETALPRPSVLPAPLYFLNTEGQIMLLEADGLTLLQVTNEPEPVIDFDVSPTDGALAFVSGNKLIETDGNGNGRIELISGDPIDPNNPADYVIKSISAPRYSPDGAQIAFGLNGINLIPIGGSDYQVVQPSDPYPDINNPGANIEGPIRFYHSAEWSPDGTRLAVQYSYFPEAGGLGLKNLGDGTFVELTNPDGITCCEWNWHPDSHSGFIASDLLAYGAPGLVRFDATTGQGQTLVVGLPPADVDPSPENPIRLFKSAFPSPDGSILTFVAAYNNFDSFGSIGLFTMNRLAPDGNLTPLQTDSHPIWEVLWADDGSGAIIVDTLFDQRYPPTGPLRWLPGDGGPALNLPANGSTLRWGRPVTAVNPAPNPTEADFANLETQALADFNIQLSDSDTGIGIDGLHYGRLNLGDGRSLWFVHTIGLRDFNTQQHTVGIYTFNGGSWQQLAMNILPDFDQTDTIPGPDYMAAHSVQQIFIEPTNGWLSVEGGIGAHGGTLHVLRFDGQNLIVEAANSNGSPVAGRVEDINGDGSQEVLLDLTDYYIFSYAAGVRLINFDILRWDGAALVPAVLTRLENTSAAATLNNEAINHTEAELWGAAEAIIEQAREQDPANETIKWNAAIIHTIGQARKNAGSSFPIMDLVFYGDYQSVIEILQGYSAAEIFSLESPIIIGTSAEGSVDLMAEQIQTFTTAALTLQPNLPEAHFLRGWAAYLLNANDPAALADVQQAAVLAPDNVFYADAAAYLQQ